MSVATPTRASLGTVACPPGKRRRTSPCLSDVGYSLSGPQQFEKSSFNEKVAASEWDRLICIQVNSRFSQINCFFLPRNIILSVLTSLISIYPELLSKTCHSRPLYISVYQCKTCQNVRIFQIFRNFLGYPRGFKLTTDSFSCDNRSMLRKVQESRFIF